MQRQRRELNRTCKRPLNCNTFNEMGTSHTGESSEPTTSDRAGNSNTNHTSDLSQIEFSPDNEWTEIQREERLPVCEKKRKGKSKRLGFSKKKYSKTSRKTSPKDEIEKRKRAQLNAIKQQLQEVDEFKLQIQPISHSRTSQ